MFKTILKIAVLSATTITLLSACGAATKALNDALKDFENRARGANIQSSIDEFGYPILTASEKAEFCSDYVEDFSISPCDTYEVSIQKLNKFCLNNPWDLGCQDDDRYDDARHEYCLNNPFFDSGCADDGRYNSTRFEACTVDFSVECTDGGLEFYPALIKFCNNPANAGHDTCFTPLEPQVDSEGYARNQFLQGTADGLNTGSLRASYYTTDTPVVYILKLSDSDDGVAFFGGRAPDVGQVNYVYYSYYAGILPDNNLGAPITQTRGTAVWQGTFSVISIGEIRRDTDFDLEIDFAEKQLSASINGFEGNDNSYSPASDYHLSGSFSDGKIEGEIHATYLHSNGHSWVEEARVRGLIGQDGVIGAFVGRNKSLDTEGVYNEGHFSGGFVARPPSE